MQKSLVRKLACPLSYQYTCAVFICGDPTWVVLVKTCLSSANDQVASQRVKSPFSKSVARHDWAGGRGLTFFKVRSPELPRL